MSEKRVNLLSNLAIDEVSFVDRGANQLAEVLISKRDEELGDEDFEKAQPTASALHIEGAVEEDEEEEDKVEEEEGKKAEEKLLPPPKSKGLLEKVFKFFDPNKKPPGLQPPAMSPGAAASPQFGAPAPQFGAPQQTAGQFGGPQMAPQPNPLAQANPFQQAPQAPQAPQQPGIPPQGLPGAPGMQAPGAAAPGMPGQPAPDASQGLAPLPQEAVDYIRELEEQIKTLSQQSAGSDHSGENPFGKNEEFEDMPNSMEILEELAKSLESEEQSDLIYKALDLVAEAEERAASAEEIAKAEREFRLNREYVELAKRYQHLPVSAEELGPVLKNLHEALSEEDITVIEKCLGGLDESMSSLFTEVGKRGGFETSSVSRVEAEAQEIMKSADGLSKEAAIEKVLSENPSLYDEYVRESATLIREA